MTLVGEQQRMLLKEVVKRAPAGVKSRSLPDAVIAQFQHSIETNEANVAEIGRQERMEKEMRVAEMHANKANNLIAHDQEIMSRPAKTWFQVGAHSRHTYLAMLLSCVSFCTVPHSIFVIFVSLYSLLAKSHLHSFTSTRIETAFPKLPPSSSPLADREGAPGGQAVGSRRRRRERQRR